MATDRQALTVYHARRRVGGVDVTTFEQLLRDPDEVDGYDPDRDLPFDARLFVALKEPQRPRWASFLEQGFAEALLPEIAQVNALLLVRVQYYKDQYFAFAFGHGRFLLRPDAYDRNYGLRVALNVIYGDSSGELDPNRLRSVDSKTVADNVLRTRRQVDRKTDFEAFGVDVRSDLLNGVTGTPAEPDAWGTRVSGRHSFSANPQVSLDDLGDFCKQIARAHRDESYKDYFEWIDNLTAVDDPRLRDALYEGVLAAIREHRDVRIAVPEIISWDEVAGLRFTFDRSITIADPEDALLGELLQAAGKLGELSLDRLRSWRLELVSSGGEVTHRWPAIQCLYGEVQHDGRTYVLTEGDFFKISPRYLDALNEFVEDLPRSTLPLPASPRDMHEGAYNEMAANSNPSYLLLDKATVHVAEHTTAIEVCDVLSDGGAFIHVKRKLNSSSLSHLFAQGHVSATLLIMNREYREAVLQKIREQEAARVDLTGDISFIGKFATIDIEQIRSREYEVVYAIVAKWNGRRMADALPFFSKVNLRRHVDDLRRMGYRVSMAPVDERPDS